jgi:hypothetical protein
MTRLATTAASLFILTAAAAPAALAQDVASNEPLDEIHVFGRGLEQIGEAEAASEGTVGYDDIRERPILRIGELAESVPGLIATQHSGGGKANQYFLRGFNLDHGTDFSVSLDGVPANIRSHAHGQGYLDLNFMIPELIERIDYSKGVYRADVGDFSAAGSARFKTYDSLDKSFVTAEIGDDGYYRGVLGVSRKINPDTSLLVGGSYDHDNGPWDLPEGLERYKGFAKITHDAGDFTTRISLFGFRSTWDGTDQVPQRAVQSGQIDRFGYIDDDSGGRTWRYGLTASAQSDDVTLEAYVFRYALNLFSDATYFLDNPVNGDAIEQADRRWVFGAKARKAWDTELGGKATTFTAGLDLKGDVADQVGLFHVEDRQRFSTVRDDNLQEYSFELWGEAETHLTDTLRMILGLRESYFTGTVDSLLAANSGQHSQSLLQPKASLAWLVTDGVELYASAGRGFHSNSVLGTVNTIDPASGDPATPVPFLVKADGAEAGARFDVVPGLKATASAFLLDLGSELVFVGDAGTSEPSSGTRRYGVEGTLFYTFSNWLTLDAEAALTKARFKGEVDDHVPQSIPFMLAGGAMFDFHPIHAALRLRHFSSTPLIEDNSVRSNATTMVNGSVSYEFGPAKATLSVFNIFDSKDADIQYYYASRMAGEAAPVEDIMFHPALPREFRFSVSVNF